MQNPGVQNPGVQNPGVQNPGVQNPGVPIEMLENPSMLQLASWDQLPNPRRGPITNRLRTIAKQTLRRVSESWLPEVYRHNERVAPEFVTERHHRIYGVPWAAGREQFNYCLERGLKPDDYVLDLGCGALRTGIWLISYLNQGFYFGIDEHLPSLRAGAEYELLLHDLVAKKPRLLCDANFTIDHFDQTFDWILSFSVFIHLSSDQAYRAIDKISKALSSGGRFIVNHSSPLPEDVMHQRYGLELVHRTNYPCQLLDSGTGWIEFEKVASPE